MSKVKVKMKDGSWKVFDKLEDTIVEFDELDPYYQGFVQRFVDIKKKVEEFSDNQDKESYNEQKLEEQIEFEKDKEESTKKLYTLKDIEGKYKNELVKMANDLGIDTSGTKQEIYERLKEYLGGNKVE